MATAPQQERLTGEALAKQRLEERKEQRLSERRQERFDARKDERGSSRKDESTDRSTEGKG